ncbi:MAG TPA: hypothetical protein VLQ47_01230, partial [Rhodoferax sp.]|nr:hypothetical protein [Rhodoferax sp.]
MNSTPGSAMARLRRQQLVPQNARRNAPVHQAKPWRGVARPDALADLTARRNRVLAQGEDQRPGAVCFDGAHE